MYSFLENRLNSLQKYGVQETVAFSENTGCFSENPLKAGAKSSDTFPREVGEGNVARQRGAFGETEIQTILLLLRSTDLPIAAIAERMGCNRSAIIGINRKYGVRDYRGRRSKWYMDNEAVDA